MVSLRSLITSSSFLTIANAGQVVMYMCQTGNTGKAVPATLAMRVQYVPQASPPFLDFTANS
jgi:hypothetical protein